MSTFQPVYFFTPLCVCERESVYHFAPVCIDYTKKKRREERVKRVRLFRIMPAKKNQLPEKMLRPPFLLGSEEV